MKRITALLLVLVMIVPGLLACDKGGKTPPKGDGATTTNAQTTKAPETTKDPNAPYVYEPEADGLYSGLVGFGTLGSSIEVSSVVVSNRKDNHELYALDPNDPEVTEPLADWQFATAAGGNWDGDKADFGVDVTTSTDKKESGKKVITFTDTASTGSMAYVGQSDWNYIKYVAKIRVNSIGDGFAVYFCIQDAKNYLELVVSNSENIVVNSVVDGVSKEEASIPAFLSDIKYEEDGSVKATIPVTISYDKEYIDIFVNSKKLFKLYGEVEAISGSVGLGSWATKNSFDNLVVTSNVDGSVLYQNDFSDPATLTQFSPRQYGIGNTAHAAAITGEWQTNWAIVDDDEEHGKVLQNSATYEGNTLVVTAGFAKDPEDDTKLLWKDYTLEFDARIDAANEGWLVFFGITDDKNYIMWNVGGWVNTATAFEPVSAGNKSTLTSISAKYTVGEWYHFTIVVHPQYAQCYINGELIDTYSALV